MHVPNLVIVLVILLVLLIFGRVAPPHYVARAYPNDIVMAILVVLIIMLLFGAF
jgi:hypothetical protein